MNTVAQLNAITADERDEAARWAKARQLGQYKGTGVYPVTVGGYVVGQVKRHAVATSKTATWWSVIDSDGAAVDGAFNTRNDAVDFLARTDVGVQAYRSAAREGVFGTKAEATQKARVEAVMAALDVELAEMDEQYAEESTEAPEAEQAATQPAGTCFYCQGELSGRTREIDYGGHRLTVHDVCVPDTEVFTEGDNPDSTPGKVVDHNGDTTMRQPAVGTVLVRWSRNTVVWTEVSVLRTREALEAERTDIDQVTPRDLDRDRRARMRPSDVQLAVVERMVEADPMTESVVVPLVFPGKDRGVWTMGQEVVAVPSYSAVNDRIDYSTCRNQAAMVGDEYLREHHTDQGGTYAYVRIEVDPTAPSGFSWFVVEDGKVPPMLKIV